MRVAANIRNRESFTEDAQATDSANGQGRALFIPSAAFSTLQPYVPYDYATKKTFAVSLRLFTIFPGIKTTTEEPLCGSGERRTWTGKERSLAFAIYAYHDVDKT